MSEPSLKIARVILFTNQMDVMSRFYGEVLALKQISNENGWSEFGAGGANIALHLRDARVQRSCSTPRTSVLCGKRLLHEEPVLGRFVRVMSFAFATAKTPTATRFSCRTAEI